MKHIKFLYTFLFLMFLYQHAVAETQSRHSFYEQLKDHDLSDVLHPDSIINDINERYKRPEPLGFIGSGFQRFQIHIISFKKSSTNPYEYLVTGKTKVNENVCSFTGTLTVLTATYDTTERMEDIGFPTYKGGTITSKMVLNESKNQSGSGSINGVLTTQVYFDNHGKLFYEALTLISDGFMNNQFEGTWTSYKTGKSKTCNWGDFRIPDSSDLDHRTGEFGVNDTYVKNGWTNYESAYHSDPNKPESKKALKKEIEVWW